MIEIAIDGTAASGKGTLARRLSVKYDFPPKRIQFTLKNKWKV